MLHKVISFSPPGVAWKCKRHKEGGARKNNSSRFLRQLSQILVRCTLLGEMMKQESFVKLIMRAKMIMRANDKGEYT